MRIMLDPAEMIPSENVDNPDFWVRLAAWASDSRVYVGASGYRAAVEYFARCGYPQSDVCINPPQLRRDAHTALTRLLTKVLQEESSDEPPALSPRHLAHDDAATSLAKDVRALGSRIAAVASSAKHWERPCASVSCLPPPPVAFDLCLEPGSEVGSEMVAAAREFLGGRRLLIVGGQVDRRLGDSLAIEFGLSTWEWIPCEKHKPPNQLRQRWSGLAPQADLAVCVTGRIGHATWGVARDVCRSRGTTLLEVETAGRLRDCLLEYVRRNRSPAQG